MKKITFVALAFEGKKKQPRREKFLLEMEAVVPWKALLAEIEPYYPTSSRCGRPPMPLATMLRIYFRVEHLFRIIKCQFGYTKASDKGIVKNAAQVFSLIGLTNLYLARRKLMS
jgi:hypothetical protein